MCSIETQTDFTRNIPTLKRPSKTSLCHCKKDKESEKFNKFVACLFTVVVNFGDFLTLLV